MTRKCCVTGCRGNYKGAEKVTVYRLPKDPEERERWIKAIPRENIPDNKDTVVCELHFPKDSKKIKVYGAWRPVDPPSVFEHLPKSLIPTPLPPKRVTLKATAEARNSDIDELGQFKSMDQIISFESLCNTIKEHEFCVDVISYANSDYLHLQSVDFMLDTAIPRFLIKISSDLTFTAYHAGVKTTIKSLSKNNMKILDCWSKLEEAVSFLNLMEKDRKKDIVIEQMNLLNAISVGDEKYEQKTLIRAFEYFTKSRSLYTRLRSDFQLPSVNTLTRLSSKVNNTSDYTFLRNIFDKITENQKQCILLLDEVYVKSSVTYHGGTIFGKAVNKPKEDASTVLAFMIVCEFGGPSFLFKMLPVKNLDSNFQFQQTKLILNEIKSVGGTVNAIICDNNRVNQSFFKKFSLKHPWQTEDDIFLLFDFVHLVKSIRNNWITESSTGKIQFKHENDDYTADWQQIRQLQKFEEEVEKNGECVKLSKLNYVAANPRPIERQKVSTCLKVFCDETVNALKVHPKMQNINVDGTVIFIEKILKFWKMVNVKSLNENIRLRDPIRAAITSDEDNRLEFLKNLAELAKELKSDTKPRCKKLTRDTSNALYQTCNGLISLSKHLLKKSHKFVLLGKYTTDPLERFFGKLRQGSGGTYYINTQQVLEKVNIHKTKILLQRGVDVRSFNVADGHNCEKCSYLVCEDAMNVFDNLPLLEDDLAVESKMSLIYIAGYVVRKTPQSNVNDEDSRWYYEKYGSFVENINRGGLIIPGDLVCQWTFFSYIMFNSISEKVCRTSLSSNILMSISEYYSFEMERSHAKILANIFFNNFCRVHAPPSDKELKQKAAKLS